jgi:ATP/maltotriose-dependent transcriptional regulator MalT
LIEAELALRDGRFELAQELAVHSAERLQCTHALTPHAHWIAGQAAHLSGNFEIASRHFQRARSTATEESDVRDALWGLVGVLIFSEVSAAHEVVVELSRRQSHSPTDLVLATNAALLLRRYSPNAGPFATETALHCLDLVPDPRVRSSFTYLLSYDALLRSDYERAQRISKATLEQSNQYQLTWAVPHAEWVLAAASLGLRKFPQVDRWLARVERAADAHDDPHLRLNAAALRARFLLALQEPARAYEILAFDDSGTVNPAMRAELIAMRALALALLGDTGRAETSAKEASSMTTSVEVAAYVACVRAICRLDSNAVREALAIAERLDIWDPMICAVRAHPPLLQLVKEAGTSLAQLGTLLRRSNDFDLARRASIPIGKRPKTERTPLSPREHEVLELISQGLTDRQIGEVLFISPGTAKVHGRHVLEKLGARTRAEAVARYKLERD